MKPATQSMNDLAAGLCNCTAEDLEVLYSASQEACLTSTVFKGWLERLVGGENIRRETEVVSDDVVLLLPAFGTLPPGELANVLQDVVAVLPSCLSECQRDVLDQMLRIVTVEICARLHGAQKYINATRDRN